MLDHFLQMKQNAQNRFLIHNQHVYITSYPPVHGDLTPYAYAYYQ